MDLTDKTFHPNFSWALKNFLMFFLAFMIGLGLAYFQDDNRKAMVGFIFVIFSFVGSLLITVFMQRRTFIGFLTDGFLVNRGFKNKKVRILYSEVSQVELKESLVDQMMGIKNASLDMSLNKEKVPVEQVPGWENQELRFIGVSGNRILIPGLKKAQAEEIKSYLLARLK